MRWRHVCACKSKVVGGGLEIGTGLQVYKDALPPPTMLGSIGLGVPLRKVEAPSQPAVFEARHGSPSSRDDASVSSLRTVVFEHGISSLRSRWSCLGFDEVVEETGAFLLMGSPNVPYGRGGNYLSSALGMSYPNSRFGLENSFNVDPKRASTGTTDDPKFIAFLCPSILLDVMDLACLRDRFSIDPRLFGLRPASGSGSSSICSYGSLAISGWSWSFMRTNLGGLSPRGAMFVVTKPCCALNPIGSVIVVLVVSAMGSAIVMHELLPRVLAL
ncbi:hypothetical protein ACFE04_014628 [Oxalis oulophora]